MDNASQDALSIRQISLHCGGNQAMEDKRKKYLSKFLNFLISISAIVLLLLIWQIVVDTGLVSYRKLAPPSKVFTTFIYKLTNKNPDGAVLMVHFWSSFKLALMGFVLAVVIGIPLGLLMGFFKSIDSFVTPIFEIIRPIPPIAWIPVMLLMFGIGVASKVAIIFLAALIPALLNSYAGVKRTSQVLINVAKTAGASRMQIFFRVAIPSAVPLIFTGVKNALNSAWMTLVAAELVSASIGLGYMIQNGRTLSRCDIIIVGMLMIGVSGAIMSGALSLIETKVAPWREKTR